MGLFYSDFISESFDPVHKSSLDDLFIRLTDSVLKFNSVVQFGCMNSPQNKKIIYILNNLIVSQWSLCIWSSFLQFPPVTENISNIFFCQELVSCQQSSWNALFFQGVIKLLWMQKLSLSHCLSLSSSLTGTVMFKYSHTPSNVIQLSN